MLELRPEKFRLRFLKDNTVRLFCITPGYPILEYLNNKWIEFHNADFQEDILIEINITSKFKLKLIKLLYF
jgi:hypothetical protein